MESDNEAVIAWAFEHFGCHDLGEPGAPEPITCATRDRLIASEPTFPQSAIALCIRQGHLPRT
jgi:hypothetical protein